jgi:hypothetical protein
MQRHYAKLRHDVVAIGADESDPPEFDLVWRAFYKGDEATSAAAEAIIVTHRLGGRHAVRVVEWEIVKAFGER